MAQTIKNSIFTRLSVQNVQTKTIDGLATGRFIDMLGRLFIVKPDELETYVKNTNNALASTKDESGKIVGFPIDTNGHDHEDAAGWIKGASLDKKRNIVLLSVEWNDEGAELIGSDKKRFFSPEFDDQAKVIMGGSLTNWPATRNANHEILLKPIDKAQFAMFSIGAVDEADSLDEQVYAVKQAFYEQYSEYDWSAYPVQVFDGYLICRKDKKNWRVKFEIAEDGAVVLDALDNWTEVKRQWVEAAIRSLQRVIAGIFEPDNSSIQNQNPDLEEDMEFDFDKLNPEQQQALLTQAEGRLVAKLSTGGKGAADLATLIDARANERVTAMLALEQRKSHVAKFSAHVVGEDSKDGSNKAGLPIQKDAIEAVLLELPEDQAKKVEDMLTAILQKGVVPFTEAGHKEEIQGARELSDPLKMCLRDFLGTDEKNTVAEFFKINASELGNMADYNLSEFVKKE
jgi:hypothetical protein